MVSAGAHHLGQEEDVLLKTPPDLLQSRQEPLVADLQRGEPFLERLLHQGDDIFHGRR